MKKPTEPALITGMRAAAGRSRRAFTIIELFFVMTIIAVLIALLLPAIQSSREIARRVQCSKNLMQIGLALGNYASTHKVFPPGVVNDKGPISGLPAGYHFGWEVQILPFLELSNLWHDFDFRQSVYTERNHTARDHRIGIYLCPSDGRPRLTSYAGCHHDVEAAIDADNHGVLFLNSHVSFTDIKDGLAQTILAGEFSDTSPTLGWAVGTRSSLRNTGWRINAPDPYPVGVGTPANPFVVDPYAADVTEIATLIKDGQVPASYVGGFSSRHPGGANFLFGDGSVRRLSERIDPHVFRSLGHRADGNLISGDDY
jgi:prepilin-type processing-associated H-X9-DG protein